jgi:hypothetical protein
MEKSNMPHVLLKDFNWFGKTIPAGTIYKKHGADYWWPVMLDGSHVPTMQVDFYTVLNNPEYFLCLQTYNNAK